MNVPALDPNLKWYGALILLIVAAAVLVPYALRVWRDVNEGVDEGSSDPDDVLRPLTEAFAAGEISREEYERVRDSLVTGTRQELTPGTFDPERKPSE